LEDGNGADRLHTDPAFKRLIDDLPNDTDLLVVIDDAAL